MKMKYILLAFFAFMIFESNTFAQEKLFENSNGIVLNEKEYNYVLQIFNRDFFDVMTIEDYENLILNKDIDNINVKTVNGDDMLIPFSTEITDGKRNIKISKSCQTNNCTISINVEWIILPLIKSYDLFGSRFEGNITYVSYPKTKIITNSNTFETNDNINYFANGYGFSIKIPSGINKLTLSQYFKVDGNGTIYSSYQHASKNISLSNSKKYTISAGGYGNVFKLDSQIESYYDKINGVSITI